ncbi:MAG TPA: helix-turn-helix domain-containing protein [Mycobacteriales bacterium]|nr:helix-turn-helix domain-containing protein [Mycobacteriales bacterium]
MGARVAFRRVATLAREAGLEPDALIPLAEATFSYIEELSAASIEGFAAEQAAQAGELDRHRHELLALLIAGAADVAAVAEAAGAAGWAVPDTLVAIRVPAPRAEGMGRDLGRDALVAAHRGAVVALVPAPETPSARAALARSLAGRQAVVGPTRPWNRAAVSLRLATMTGRLVASGVLSADPVFVDEHLATLVVHRDPELVADLVARRLAVLEQVRDGTRDRLAETLLAWLIHRGERQRVAETLHVHPQTVGYRMTQLRKLSGAALDDPGARFELEIALRAVRTRAGAR